MLMRLCVPRYSQRFRSTNVSIVELLPVNEKIQKQFPKLYKSVSTPQLGAF